MGVQILSVKGLVARRGEPRCSLYRLSADHHVPVHDPAACRQCWSTCREPAAPGRQWCEACEEAAAASGDPRVVALLDSLTEPSRSPEELVSDLLGSVRT